MSKGLEGEVAYWTRTEYVTSQAVHLSQPADRSVPTGDVLVHHLQVVDSERLKSPTHFVDRTATLGNRLSLDEKVGQAKVNELGTAGEPHFRELEPARPVVAAGRRIATGGLTSLQGVCLGLRYPPTFAGDDECACFINGTARRSSANFSISSRRRCRAGSMCTSSSTTTAPIKRR